MTCTDYTRISQGLSMYKQARSPHWFAQIYIGDRKYKSISTKEKSKIIARKVAEELFLEMKGNKEINVSPDRKFKYFANELVKQEKQLSKGETRSERFSKDTQQVIHRDEKGLIAFFGNKDVSKITTNHIREFFINLDADRPQPLSFSTKNKYLITLKKIFRVAYEFNVIDKIPLLPKIDVGRKNKDNPRPSFSEEEYKLLLRTIRLCESKKEVVDGTPITLEHYYCILFQVHTFMRPTYSELFGVRHKDITVMKNPQRLDIQVKGKTGFRTVSSLPYAVEFYSKLQKLHKGFKPNDFLFLPQFKNRDYAKRKMNDIFNHFLEKCDLKFTSLKQPRQLYSLRHYAIQTRIRKSQGKVNIYFLARNAGTSVEQLERFYLKHMELSDTLIENLAIF